MEFAISLPQWSPDAGADAWSRIAETAETLGFTALWRGDHVAFPTALPEGGVLGADERSDAYDVFASLAYLAAETETIALGSNIAVAPYRHPVVLCKQALTLDALSGGRFEFGVGAGWLEPEFALLDVPFGERGARTTEFLELFDQVVEHGVTGFEGPFHSFEPAGFSPRPVRPDGPPVWVGGTSSAALDRVARFGDGWTVIGFDPETARAGYQSLLEACERHGRPDEPEFAVTVGFELTDEPAEDGELVGPPETVIERIRAYADAGVSRLVLRQRGQPVATQLDQLERFATRIDPEV